MHAHLLPCTRIPKQSWCRKKFDGRAHEIDAFFAENGFSDTLEYYEP